MPTEDFVMRGKTPSGEYTRLNFSMKNGYAFRLMDFEIYFSSGIGTTNQELMASVTADKLTGSPPASPADPQNPDFSQEGLIANATLSTYPPSNLGSMASTVVNDTYLISQDIFIAVLDSVTGSPADVNWQCTFRPVKLTETEQANVNFRQFSVFDD